MLEMNIPTILVFVTIVLLAVLTALMCLIPAKKRETAAGTESTEFDLKVSGGTEERERARWWWVTANAVADDRWEEASWALSTLLEHEKENLAARYFRGAVYLRQNNITAALSDLKKLAGLSRSNPKVHVVYGLALERSGNITDAIIEYQIALRHAPDFPPARAQLGRVYEGQGKLEAARAEYLALVKSSYPAAGHLGLAELAYRGQNLIEAEEEFLKALRADQLCSQAYLGLASLYIRQNRQAAAVHAILRGIQTDMRMEKYFRKFSKNIAFLKDRTPPEDTGEDIDEDTGEET